MMIRVILVDKVKKPFHFHGAAVHSFSKGV